MNDVMIDIETLGAKPGSVILSVAAVRFDLKTGNIGDEYYSKISLNNSLKIGMKIEGDTLKWWLKQSQEVFKDQLSEGMKLYSVLGDLNKIITSNDKVWGNSNRFDLGHLDYAYNLVDQTPPWKFYNERDVRTLVSFAPEIKDEMPFEGSKHSPIDDCKHQIKYCCAIWKKLNL